MVLDKIKKILGLSKKEEKKAKEEVMEGGEEEEILEPEPFREVSKSSLEEHVEKHLAVVDGQIVASGDDPDAVLEEGKKKYPEEDITLTYVATSNLLLECRCLAS